VIRYACSPNNEILAIWGLYGAIYAAIGVAHALQGPRRKWRPRIILISVAIGLTACAHISAAIVGVVWSAIFLLYLAERRRSQTIPILIFASVGALVMLFLSYSLRVDAYSYVFTGGGALMGFSLGGARHFFSAMENAPITIAALTALLLFAGVQRSRYFGNAVPLGIALSLLPLITTQVESQPWLWALPFLFTFIAGVFADALETRQRKLFLALSALIVVTQALLCLTSLPTLTSIAS
jgi:membrane associated rhomboid family serine protease